MLYKRDETDSRESENWGLSRKKLGSNGQTL